MLSSTMACLFKGCLIPVGIEIPIPGSMSLADVCLFARRELPAPLRADTEDPCGLCVYPDRLLPCVVTVRPGMTDVHGRPARGRGQHHVVAAVWADAGGAVIRLWSPGDEREPAIGPFDVRESEITGVPAVMVGGARAPIAVPGWAVGRMDRGPRETALRSL